MPGLAVRVWPMNRVEKHPWVQIPTGEVGLVIAQAGAPLPTGWKSGVYKPVFGQFTDVRTFVAEGGQQGVQRPVLPPGAILPLHPVAFLVLSQSRSFGLPVNAEYRARFGPALFGLEPEELTLRVIEPVRERTRSGSSNKRSSISSASSRPWRESHCPPATSRAGWVASTTCARWKPPAAATPRSPTC